MMVSMRTVFASSKPWNRQPLNHRQATPSSPASVAWVILSTLDFPAPQSPWIPIVSACSRFSLRSATTVLATAS